MLSGSRTDLRRLDIQKVIHTFPVNLKTGLPDRKVLRNAVQGRYRFVQQDFADPMPQTFWRHL